MRRLLPPEHVGFNLVDHRCYVKEGTDACEADRREVEDTDRANETRFVSALHISPSGMVVAVRLVQKHQIDVVGAELLEGLLDGIVDIALTVVGDPYPIDEEDIVAVDAELFDALADAFLIAVGLSGVDQTAAAIQSILDAVFCLIVSDLEGSVAEHRPSRPLASFVYPMMYTYLG